MRGVMDLMFEILINEKYFFCVPYVLILGIYDFFLCLRFLIMDLKLEQIKLSGSFHYGITLDGN